MSVSSVIGKIGGFGRPEVTHARIRHLGGIVAVNPGPRGAGDAELMRRWISAQQSIDVSEKT